MITEQLNKLNDAAKAFLNDKNFGAMELEEVMDDVFGADRTVIEAVEWKGYWKQLELYEEKLTEDPFTAGTCYSTFFLVIHMLGLYTIGSQC